MERIEQETYDRTDPVSDRIISQSFEAIHGASLEPEEEIIVLTDVVTTLFAAITSRYQKQARPKIENIVLTLTHSRASAFDDAHKEIFTGKTTLN